MAHDVFVSYAARDKPTADAVCATLEAKHIRCWIAPRDVLPGQDYPEALVEAIGQSRLMVLVFSSSSNNSPHVMREAERAVSKGIPILPLRIEDVSPSKSMEYFISRTHWLDALTPPLKRHLHRLAEMTQLLLSRAEAGEAVAGAPTIEAAVDEGPGRPTSLRQALESVKGWVGRPMVRLALGIGGIGAVTIVVLVMLLSAGGGGASGPAALAPSATSSPSASRTPTPGPTATPTSAVTQPTATQPTNALSAAQPPDAQAQAAQPAPVQPAAAQPAAPRSLPVWTPPPEPTPPPPTAERVSIEVDKLAYMSGDLTFDFTLDGPSGYHKDFALLAFQNFNFTNLESGVYTIREQQKPGWYLSSIDCFGAVGVQERTTIDLFNYSVTITLQPGDWVYCDFDNQEF